MIRNHTHTYSVYICILYHTLRKLRYLQYVLYVLRSSMNLANLPELETSAVWRCSVESSGRLLHVTAFHVYHTRSHADLLIHHIVDTGLCSSFSQRRNAATSKSALVHRSERHDGP